MIMALVLCNRETELTEDLVRRLLDPQKMDEDVFGSVNAMEMAQAEIPRYCRHQRHGLPGISGQDQEEPSPAIFQPAHVRRADTV